MTGLAGRHVVVTGASSGIGRASALLLARRGAKVSMIARRADRLAEIRAMAEGETFVAAADISDRAALRAALDEAQTVLGPIDGLFANAGTGGVFAPFADYDDAVFEAVLRTNLLSPFWAMKQVLPGMMARRQGAILITGSLASERGMARNPGYVASKHAVLGLARAAAIEAAPCNVRVNCVVPGFIETEMLAALGEEARGAMAARTPQGRTGSPEELAEVAAFLLSDASTHVTGQCWAVDGGILNTLTV